ncbi:MAG TPA: FAD-dependent oxidoreductase [Anaerolineaceae bacterium]|nr:FAD-dependent oxidoreductase [Anaerolineaceae bacterium]
MSPVIGYNRTAERDHRLLLAMPEELGQATLEALRRKHVVDVRLNTAVESYDGHVVRLGDGGQIRAETLIWAAGVRAVSVLDTLGVEQDRSGRVVVEPTLQVPGHPEVFVVGDAAFCKDEEGRPLPMMAPVAMQQASHVAGSIIRLIEGRPLEAFRYKDPGSMATIGRNQAVAHIGRWKLRGFIAWVMWLAVHIYQLIGFRNRLAVLIDWAWSYIFYERAVRLIGPP